MKYKVQPEQLSLQKPKKPDLQTVLLLDLLDEGKLDFLAARLFKTYNEKAPEEQDDRVLELSSHLLMAAQLCREMKEVVNG